MPSHKKQIQNERNKVILTGTEHILNLRLSILVTYKLAKST